MKAVVVVVLSWNKQEAVLDCIARVKALRYPALHVVVVDNASSDDSVAVIRHAHPDATVLEERVNTGFAGGVNRGLAEADRRGADYAWLLNDDTLFEGDVLTPLVAHAESLQRCGLVTPRLVDLPPSSTVQFRHGFIDWSIGRMRHNLDDPAHAAGIAAGATPIVAGTALLCDLRAYRTIGAFDERFFAYWEDTDYSVRSARAGFVNAVCPTATVAHAAPTPDERPPHYHYYMIRNEALFWRLHGRESGSAAWRRRWLADSLEVIGRCRDRGRIDAVRAGVDALWHAWHERDGPRSNHAPAPRWFALLVATRPWLLAVLVRGDLASLARRVSGISAKAPRRDP